MMARVILRMDRTLHPLTAMPRSRLCLLLPLLLILSQHGAWLHQLSHAVYAAHAHPVTVEQAQANFENGVCPTCQSFGQLGSPLASSIAVVAAAVTPLCPHTEPRYLQPSADLPSPRNRGPPHLV